MKGYRNQDCIDPEQNTSIFAGCISRSAGKPLLLSVVIIISELYGANGKVMGRVTDSLTGEPLPAVNIVIDGTDLGAATDNQGYYFVLNLPPRTYDIRAGMIGYTALTKTGVIVNANYTTTLNFVLSPTVLEAQEIVVTADREVVKMDMVSTSQIVGADIIANTPYRGDFDQIFMTQAGWGDWSTYSQQALQYKSDKFGVRAGTGEDQGFEVRGGGEWQVNLMVDGMSLKDMTSGYQFTKLNLANIQEVELLTGGFNAEYGEARAGVINVITKEGQDLISASVDIKTSAPGIKHFGPAVNDTTASVFNYDYGARLGYGEYWDSDSSAYISLEGTAYTGNPIFPGGWLGLAATLSSNHPWYPILEGGTHADSLEVANYLRDEWLWQHRPELWDYGSQWDYNIETTLSGPVPFLRPVLGKTYFFGSYRTKYSEWMYPRSGGQNGGYNDFTAQLKVNSNPLPGFKLSYNIIKAVQYGGFEYRTDLENFAFGHILETPIQEFNQLGRGDFAEQWAKPDHNGLWMKPTDKRNHTLQSINLSLMFNEATFVDASLQYAHHWNELVQAELRDTKVIPDELFEDSNRNGIWDTGEGFVDTNNDGDWTAGYYAHRIGKQGFWKYYDEAPSGRIPGLSSQLGAIPGQTWQDESYSRTWTFKASITSQINLHHQLKSGVDIIASKEHLFRLKPKEGGVVWHFDAEPLRISGYLQDKLEYKGLNANFGVRIDGFDPEDSSYDFLKNPYNPLFGRSGPGNPLYQTSEDSLKQVTRLGRGNLALDVFPDSLMFNPPWQVNWSPRLGISHPVSADGKIFFNYGNFYQPPRSIYLFGIYQRGRDDWKLHQVGNPRLKMEKTTAWEVGYEHSILNTYRLSASGYYRHVLDEVSRLWYNGTSENQVSMYSYWNDRYHDIRGVDFKFEKRVGRFVTGSFNYDLTLSSSGQAGFIEEYQQGTAKYTSLAERGVYVAAEYDSVLRVRQTQDQSQIAYPARSRIRINLDLHTPTAYGMVIAGLHPFGDWRANFLFQWTEGSKFTYNPTGQFYVSENMQWMGYRQTDLKLSKRIALTTVNLTVYLEVYNLFNTKNFNMLNYFGSPEADGAPFPEQQSIYYDSIIENGYKLGETDREGIILPYGPEYALYFPKRDVYFGLIINLP